MVIVRNVFLLAILAQILTPIGWAGRSVAADDPAPVPSALKDSSLPWYDSEGDRIKSVPLPGEPWDPFAWLRPSRGSSAPSAGVNYYWIGAVIRWTGILVAVGVLAALMAWFYRLYEPSAGKDRDKAGSKVGRGAATQALEELPAGLQNEFESSDPWAESLRRRDRGDLAGAVVCLFAHQLITLSRLELVRLAPGRTGRQLVKAVSDAEFRKLVTPTLRLFELVYYGHQIPTHEAFAEVWAVAEQFERWAATGGKP